MAEQDGEAEQDETGLNRTRRLDKIQNG